MEKLNNKFIIFGKGFGWFNSIFDDIEDYDNFCIGHDSYCPCWQKKISNLLCRLTWGSRFGHLNNQNFVAKVLIKIMCKKIHKKYPNGAVCIFHRSNVLAHNTLFLNQMRKYNPKCKLVYWFEDLFSSVQKNIPNILDICKTYYDYVVSYEKNDAQKYNFLFLREPYSYKKNLKKIINFDKKIDLLFIGKAKLEIENERYSKIIKVYEEAKRVGLKTVFIIPDVPIKSRLYQDEIIYDQFLDYFEVLKYVAQSRCILEVSQKDATGGTTLRLYESIAYNAKLLFTNKSMIENEFYDNNRMLYIDCDNLNFNNISDFINKESINNNFVLEQISPTRFLNEINRIVNEY